MRPLILLLAVTAGALLAGALLSPALHLLPAFADVPFHKLQENLSKLAGFGACLLFLHYCGGISRIGLGFGFGARDLHAVLLPALGAGLLLIAMIEAVQFALGLHVAAPRADFGAGALLRLLAGALLLGLVVALIEETMFRGALFSGMQRRAGAAAALVATTLLYAVIHFIKFKPLKAGVEIGWDTGFLQLTRAFARLGNPIVFDSLLTLLALGLLLGLLRLARGHLAACIGLHAGVVAGLRISGKLGDYRPGTQFDFLVNRWNPELGWLATGVIAAATCIWWLLLRRGKMPA